MPELPEVQILVEHLAALLINREVVGIKVRRPRCIRASSSAVFRKTLMRARFQSVCRRGKYLVFKLRRPERSLLLVAHLGMTGRMYLTARNTPSARHAVLDLVLGREKLVFEDARRFGGVTLDSSCLELLGPEPLGKAFTVRALQSALARSRQSIKVKLLDQTVVAGIGNIYSSESLFLAGIHPAIPARDLSQTAVARLRDRIRQVLREAIRFGSTVPLDFEGAAARDGLFYYGVDRSGPRQYKERLRVYDREGAPCLQCGGAIRRIVQAARSTYYCPRCQPRRRRR